MATVYPAALDALPNPRPRHDWNTVGYTHSDQHSDANDAIEALQAHVGIDGSADTASLDYLFSQKRKLLTYKAVTTPGATSKGISVLNTPSLVDPTLFVSFVPDADSVLVEVGIRVYTTSTHFGSLLLYNQQGDIVPGSARCVAYGQSMSRPYYGVVVDGLVPGEETTVSLGWSTTGNSFNVYWGGTPDTVASHAGPAEFYVWSR